MTKHASLGMSFASFYDFYDAPEYRQEQLRMYCELASQAGDPILELACGTGIITIELARAGSQVTGLDISADMLEVAREKMACEESDVRSRIRLVEADMRAFALDERFGGVFLPSNSFGYLTASDDRRSCLQAIYDHLRPGGLLVLEERNYTPEVLMGMLQRRGAITMQRAGINPATGTFTTFHSATLVVDFIAQTLYGRRFIDEIQDDGTVKRYTGADGGAYRMHYFSRFELQLLIEGAGFTVGDLWGGHDRGPLGPRSYSMIFLAHKQGETK